MNTITPPASASVAPAPAATARDRVLGILLLVAAVACFACLDACGKWMGRATNPAQTAAMRYVGSFLLVSIFLNPWSRPAILRTRTPWLQVFRGLGLATATICSLTALRTLPLTVTTSIVFASPLLVALIAGPLLGEWIGPRRAVAVFVGFLGVLVITRPWRGEISPAMGFAVITAITTAGYTTATRKLAAGDRPETTMFYTGLVGSLVFLPVLPFVWETPDTLRAWLVVAGLIMFSSVGHWLLIIAHKLAPASTVAPFFYAQLLWAMVVGRIVFGEVPDRFTLIGGGIVMASGLYLLARERVRRSGPSTGTAV
jgi:drug/metabolite transporter (DMT)-like permease